MPQNNPQTALEQIAARYERRLETVRRIQELVQDDPVLASEIVAALNSQSHKAPPCKKAGATNFERVKAFFLDGKNAWTSTPDISRALGIKRGPLGQILHQTHARWFQKKPKPGSKKIKMWRLRKEVMQHEKIT